MRNRIIWLSILGAALAVLLSATDLEAAGRRRGLFRRRDTYRYMTVISGYQCTHTCHCKQSGNQVDGQATHTLESEARRIARQRAHMQCPMGPDHTKPVTEECTPLMEMRMVKVRRHCWFRCRRCR